MIPIPRSTYSDRPGEHQQRLENWEYDTEEQRERENEYREMPVLPEHCDWGWVFHVIRRSATMFAAQESIDRLSAPPYSPEQKQCFVEAAAALEVVLAKWSGVGDNLPLGSGLTDNED